MIFHEKCKITPLILLVLETRQSVVLESTFVLVSFVNLF